MFKSICLWIESFKKSRIDGAAKNVRRSTENENLLDLRSRTSSNGRKLQDIVRTILSRAPRVS